MQIRRIAGSAGLVLLLAAPVLAQSFPLGHHRHEFQRAKDRVAARGWDPSYSARDQADKDRLTAAVETYPVGLPVLLDSRFLGDQENLSWGGRKQKHLAPCFLGNSREHFRGEGNAASDGSTQGIENLAARSWNVDAACNGRPVPDEVKARIAAKRKELETWRDEIRAAAAAARR